MLFLDQMQHRTGSKHVAATELNQLKYTCRELNRETKRLTTSLNEIIFLNVFSDASHDRGISTVPQTTVAHRTHNSVRIPRVVLAGVEVFIDFMKIVTSRRFKCPSAVTIVATSYFKHDVAGFFNLFNFCGPTACVAFLKTCQEHPKFAIKLRHDWLNLCYTGGVFFDRVVQLMMHFRKERDFRLPGLKADCPEDGRVTDKLSWRHFDEVDDVGGYPANLRLFPSFTHFDSSVFRKRVIDYGHWRILTGHLEGGVDAAIALAEKVFEWGI